MWPPSGRRSRNASTPEHAGGERDRREHEDDRPVERMGRARSRQSAGSTAAVTAVYAAASSTNGTPFSTTVWVASVTRLL